MACGFGQSYLLLLPGATRLLFPIPGLGEISLQAKRNSHLAQSTGFLCFWDQLHCGRGAVKIQEGRETCSQVG